MKLHRVQRPVSAPIIVEVNLNRFVLLLDAVGKYFLDAGVFGEGNVRTDVEEETRLVSE